MFSKHMKLDGAKLIDARHRRGLNQGQVATGASISIVTVCNAENEKDVYPATGKKLCDFLGLDIADSVLPSRRNSSVALTT